MTVIKYTTAPVDGPESDVEYDEYGDAMNVAQRFWLQVIAVHYERADSGLVEDFTEYHWLLTARCGGEEDDGYLPDGPDACFDHPDDAMGNLHERLTLRLRNLDGCEEDPSDGKAHCGECNSCRGYERLVAAVRALADVDSDDVEEHGYSRTVAADPEVPVVYRITRITSTQCHPDNHT